MSLVKRTRTDLDLPKWFTTMFELGDEGEFRVEEFVEGDQLVVRAELPGMDPDKDVEVTVSDHTLRIKAERRQESRTEEPKGFRSEFRYGTFVRTMALPVGASEDDVKATYTDGVLEVRMPLDKSTAEARKVAITRT